MRVSVLVGLALALGCGGAAPTPVTIAGAKTPPVSVRAGFAASGRIERELASLEALDAAHPDTRPGRYAREAELLADLSRCDEARKLAGEIATTTEDAAKQAAREAVAECERLDRKPTQDELTRARAAFHEARRIEATDPARAEKLYAQAWTDAPSVAVMLGLARAAKAAGDAALAERSFERALARAERGGEKATIAVTPGAASDAMRLETLDVRDGAATLALQGWQASGAAFLRQDLATGALRVLGAIPAGFYATAATNRFALLAATPPSRTEPPRLFEIGVDDELTATPLDALVGAEQLALSNDGEVAAARAGRVVLVLDLATRKLLAKTTLPGDTAWIGVTTDHDVVVREPNKMCVLSPPSYGACRVDAALNLAAGAAFAFAAPPIVAGRRIAFLDGFNAMRVYDVHEARVLHDFTGKFTRVTSLSLSPDGATLISTSPTRGHYMWDVATGNLTKLDQIGEYDERGAPIWADSKRVILGHDAPGTHASWIYTLPGRELVAAGALTNERRVFAVGARGTLFVGGFGVVARVDLARRTVRTFAAQPEEIAVSPDESLVAVRRGTPGVDVFDAAGKRVASADTDSGAMRFEGRTVVVAADPSTEEVLDLGTQKVTKRPASAAPAAQQAPWILKSGADGLVEIEDAATHARSRLDVAGDAFVWARDGKITIGGDEASVGCRVGSAWLPLDACRDRFLGQ